MFNRSFNQRPLIENSQVISVSVYVRDSFIKLKNNPLIKDIKFDFNDEKSVKDLMEMIESCCTINLKQETNGQVEFTEPNKIKLTYSKSNLGKGFVFWFVCGVCGRRVRYLYIPPNSQVTACRKCHRLAYRRQNENKRFRV